MRVDRQTDKLTYIHADRNISSTHQSEVIIIIKSTSIFGDGRISTHAHPASTRRAIFHERRISVARIGQRAGHADSSDFGLFGL